MFCPECGSMMFPVNGVYVCRGKIKDKVSGNWRDCTCTRPIGEKATILKTDAQEKTIAVVGDNEATLPKQSVICPVCGYNEAYYTIRQNRAADEPETIFYRCCKCNNRWNVN